MDKPYKYSSTQIQTTPEVSENFLSLGKELIPNADLFGDGFETDPHITVLYGIHDVHPSPPLIDVMETYPKFAVTLGTVSLFDDNEEFDVVKAEIECNDLYVLHSTLLNICHYTLTHPEYIPHATMAFVKKGSCDHLIGSAALKGLTFVVDSVIFSSSDGTKRKIMLGVR